MNVRLYWLQINVKFGKIQYDAGVRPIQWMIYAFRWLKISSISTHWNQLISIVTMTSNQIGMAKKRMLDMVPTWRDRGINKVKELKFELHLDGMYVLSQGEETGCTWQYGSGVRRLGESIWHSTQRDGDGDVTVDGSTISGSEDGWGHVREDN